MIVPVGVIVLQEGQWIVRVVDLTRISYREVLRGRTARMGNSDREDDGDTVGGFDGQTETLNHLPTLISIGSRHVTSLPRYVAGVFVGLREYLTPTTVGSCSSI